MAPSGESVYFPPLESCFAGGAQLISWKTVFTALSNSGNIERGGALDRFLSDQTAIDILADPFNLYKPPSQPAKSSFETKTAAINVTPTTQGQYDIDEIKEDALWLSNETKIDEVAALRIVILEWQTRPAVQLLAGFSDEEVASIQDASGVENLRNSVGGARVSSLFATVGSQAAQSSDFLLLHHRRSRFLGLYLSERRHVLKVSQMFLSAGVHLDRLERQSEQTAKAVEAKGDQSWIEEIGRTTRDAQSRCVGSRSINNHISHIVPCLKSRIENLNNGSGWFKGEGGIEQVEDAWGNNMIEEMTHIMQIMFIHLDSSRELLFSKTALTWFQLMARYGFFEAFNPASESQAAVLIPFQSSIAVVSLAMMQLHHSIPVLLDPELRRQVIALEDSRRPLFTDLEVIAELNDVFMDAAGAAIVIASPSVFAWVMIVHTLGTIALEPMEDRGPQQSRIDLDGDDFADHLQDSPLSRKSSSLLQSTRPTSNAETIFHESLYDLIKAPLDEGYVTHLAALATDECHVFDAISLICENFNAMSDLNSSDKTYNWVRLMFLEFLRNASNFLDYMPELVSALLSILSPSASWQDSPWRETELPPDDPRQIFVDDRELMAKFFRIAQSRFPYETLPFLKLSKALAMANVTDEDGLPFVALAMGEIASFTQKLPEGFDGYQTVREDENANYVSLKKPLEIFPITPSPNFLSPRSHSALVAHTDSYTLPIGTIGRVISESGSSPTVVYWTHEYSGLGYLGRWLEKFLSFQAIDMLESPEEIAVEIVGLLAALLESSFRAGKQRRGGVDAAEEARKLLELASDDVDRSGDIISVVFSIFEKELQNVSNATLGDRPLDLLLVCLQFLQVTVKVLPGRVWPFLARSSFLGIEGRGSMLSTVVSSVEVPSGKYDFLMGSIRLFVAVVEDAVSNSVVRKGFVETRSRTPNPNSSYSGIPTHVLTKVLHAFGQVLVEVYESSASWRFNEELQRSNINATLAATFDKILYYAYGIDEANDLSSKVTAVLSNFAPYLLDFFLAHSPRDITFNPLLRVIFDGITTPQSTLYLKPRKLWVSQVKATLGLSNILVKAGRLLGYPGSSLEMQLFKASPVLVRLYASDEDYKHSVVTLMESLIKDAGDQGLVPPSLLGNLGTITAKNFGDCLSTFDKPLDDIDLEIRIWNLLSALVSNRQQWIAIVLLTGTTPRNTLEQKDSSTEGSMRSKTLLATAITLLADIDALDPRLAIAVLEFVALAQEYWPWAVADFNQHPNFITSLFEFMSKIKYANDSMMSNCYTARVGSLVADIIAIHLHHSRQSGRDAAARQKNEINHSLPWLVENGSHATGYNSSLHKNLERNLAQKYPGCKLADFKRTPLQRLDFGKNFFYDNDIAGKLLSYHRAWHGPSKREQGFEDEFRRANINLSKFEAQMQLLHSWKFLASELCYALIEDTAFQRMMVQVVVGCLNANLRGDSPGAIFASLMQTRAEFGLEILQQLTTVARNLQPQDKEAIVAKAVEAIRAAGGSFAGALLDGNLDYYRLLLKILFLALQCSTSEEPMIADDKGTRNDRRASKSPDILNLCQEILTVVVAKGFRDLTANLHEDPDKGSPPDFAILDAILRSCLQIKDIDRIYPPLVTHFGENGAARSAITLFSYGDKLTVDGDPIYGDLSIRFLLQLSTIPTMAEELAVEGLLSNISASGLTNYYRRQNGSGPFDQPSRIYTMWASGLLPICLNLLQSVGRPMAPEVSAFLNQFQPQLDRATTSFVAKYAAPSRSLHRSAAGSITLSMASESNSLALISFILETWRVAGASAGVDAHEIAELKWDGRQVKEDIEELLANRDGLRTRIVATDEKEMAMLQAKPVDASSGAHSKLEERVMKELRGAMMCLGGGQE